MKKKQTIIKWILLFLLITIVLLVSISSYVHIVGRKDMVTESTHLLFEPETIMVLGAGVKADGTPSAMLADRLDKGIQLYQHNLADSLLFTGDNRKMEYNEVKSMATYAFQQDISPDVIFLDYAGFTTYESLIRARDVFQVRQLIIVTQQYHLPRALYIANELGMQAKGIAAEKKNYQGQTLRDIREIFANVKAFWQCFIKAEPTFYGDPVPVSGLGNAMDLQ